MSMSFGLDTVSIETVYRSFSTDNIEIDLKIDLNDTNFQTDNCDEKQMQNSNIICDDELYKWCVKFGFAKYYKKFIYDFGIESLDEILESSIDDLIDVCNDLKFSSEEKQTFLSTIMSCNKNNELKSWCNTHKLNKMYELLIKNGYFCTQQLSKLAQNEQIELCKRLNIKFGTKTRFVNNIPCNNREKSETMKSERNIIRVKSDELHTDNDMTRNRTVLMVGETGTGKTTTINSMMNYLYDATFEGNRYQLIYEKFDDKKETDSQTSKISVYYVTPTSIDYTLTIIDTPGFGNVGSQGIEFDQVIVKQLQTLFETQVTEIDAICFVIKASQNKLTERQKYIFQEVINVFGQNVSNNILLLFTFSDFSVPKGLAAVTNNRPKIPHRGKYFKYNNDVFSFDEELIEPKRVQWNRAMETFADLFEEITKLETQSLQLSKQVLNYRNSLKNAVNQFQMKLKDGLIIYESIIQRISMIKNNKRTIDLSDEKLVTIQVPESKKVIKKKINKKNKKDLIQSFHVCEQHKLTCVPVLYQQNYSHSSSGTVYVDPMGMGTCWVCPRYDCNQKSVIQAKYKYELVLTEIVVQVRKLDSGYLDATVNQPRSDRLLSKERMKLKQTEHGLCQLIVKIRNLINKIKELALNKDLLKTNDYFDILIERETKNCKKGWKQRVHALESLQTQQELIAKIEKSMNLNSLSSIFPELEQIESLEKDDEKKENERINCIHKTNNFVITQEKLREKKSKFRDEKWLYFWTIKVYDWTYNDLLRDLRGHINQTDVFNEKRLMQIRFAKQCGWFCAFMYSKRYNTREFKDANVVRQAVSSDRGFPHSVKWLIVYEGSAAYLTFAGQEPAGMNINKCINLAGCSKKLFPQNDGRAEEIQVDSVLYCALRSECEQIIDELKKCKIGNKNCKFKRLFITGHGVGGGLAILFAYEMIRRKLIDEKTQHSYAVVTFGAPSVLAYNGKKLSAVTKNAKLRLLNRICHCYVNRLDPIPRLMMLLTVMPDSIEKLYDGILKENKGKWKYLISDKSELVQLRQAALSLRSRYFNIGTQYIWCGKHKEWYCGEEMKIRLECDILNSFDKNCETFKNIPLKIWKQMLEDHSLTNYYEKLKGKSTLI